MKTVLTKTGNGEMLWIEWEKHRRGVTHQIEIMACIHLSLIVNRKMDGVRLLDVLDTGHIKVLVQWFHLGGRWGITINVAFNKELAFGLDESLTPGVDTVLKAGEVQAPISKARSSINFGFSFSVWWRHL